MSDASIIKDVSETLRSILDAHFNLIGPADAGGSSRVGAPVTITIDNPQRSAGEDLRINLYLYHILQDESRRNTGPIRRPPPEPLDPKKALTLVPEPLPLKLYYMVTAFAPDGGTEHRLIGETLQALYSHRILGPEVLKGGLASPTGIKAEVIQVVMLNQDLETLHRIWGNFQEALRPSATFEVEGIYLDALDASELKFRVQEPAIGVVPVPYLTEVRPAEAQPGASVRLHGANLDVRSPDGKMSLVRILFDGKPVTPLPDRTNRKVGIVIPPDAKAGRFPVQAKIGEYVSTVMFEVLPP